MQNGIFKKYYEVPENMISEYENIFNTVLYILTGRENRYGNYFGGGIIIENIHDANAPYISIHLTRRMSNIDEKKGWLCIVARNCSEMSIKSVEKYCSQFKELSEDEYYQERSNLEKYYKSKNGFIKRMLSTKT